MHRLAEAVPGPVQDRPGVAGAAQHGHRGAVDLEAADLLTGTGPLLHELDGRVAGVAHRGKRLGDSLRYLSSRISHPGDISKHRARLLQLPPEIQEQHLVSADRPRCRRRRQVVRVAGIAFRGNDRRRIADQALIREPAGHQLLNLELGGGRAVPDAPRRLLERAILDSVQLLGGGDM